MYVAERSRKDEQVVKAKIVEARERGLCDREGRTLPPGKRGGAGKGDRLRSVNRERYEAGYVLAFGHE
jgi:hypothetical protein